MHRSAPDDAACRPRSADPTRGASPGSSSSTARGWILLQERDELPRIDPEKWGLAGGHVDPGEDFEPAATASSRRRPAYGCRRAGCELFREFVVDHREAYGTWDRMQVFVAATDLTDADIDCHEGRQIVFVDPAVARGPRPQLGGHRHRPGLPRQRRLRQHGAMTAQTFTVHPVPSMGAEDVVVAPDGTVFTGTEDGAIWALDPATGSTRRVADTGGRPLGHRALRRRRPPRLRREAGRAAGRRRGDRRRRGAASAEVDGEPMRFCNNAAVAGDGTIWFSDSSLHYGMEQWKDDFVQHTRTGRLLRRDPDGTVEVVLDGLAFANGVALAADESYVAVAECRGRTVVRLWLAGPRAGERDHLVTDLPGLPRQHQPGQRRADLGRRREPGRPASSSGSARRPMPLRKAVTRIPEALQPKPAADDPGAGLRRRRPARARPRPAGPERGAGYHMVTGVREHDGRVWLGSLHEPAVAVLDRP